LFAESRAWSVLKRLVMGLALIAFLSAILLVSDLRHRKTAAAASPARSGRTYKAAIVYFARDTGTDLCVQGLVDGLRDSSIYEGKNLDVTRVDAQGEMINIPAILQNYDESDVDLIMTISTPCLSGACSRVKNKPVVFTCVTDPIAGGRGKEPHRPLAVCDGRGKLPAGRAHVGFNAEAGAGIAGGGHNL
jgi:putative ABC transport system substrate-binding protein